MRNRNCFCLGFVALAIAGCQPPAEPVFAPPPAPSPTPVVLELETAPELALEIPAPAPSVAEADKPTIALPPPPVLTSVGMQFLLSTGGRNLVFEFETGGQRDYDPHPERPPGPSGITWGIGYDGGYYSAAVIKADWAALEPSSRNRLAAVSGLKGQRAQDTLRTVRDIYVQWAIATDVFDRVDVAREYSSAKRAMPGFDDLRPNAQAAIISLGFNRGWSMSGANRSEMRAIRDLVPRRDYEGIAIQFRKMVRVWIGTKIEKGMTRRRIAEAKLIMTP